MNFFPFVDLEQVKENNFKFGSHHGINILQGFFNIPGFVAVPQKLVKILMLDLFLYSDKSLQNCDKFCFLEFVGFFVQDFFNVSVFLN